jgi:hypothetical protein
MLLALMLVYGLPNAKPLPGYYLADDACLPQLPPPAYVAYLTTPTYIIFACVAVVIALWVIYTAVGIML